MRLACGIRARVLRSADSVAGLDHGHTAVKITQPFLLGLSAVSESLAQTGHFAAFALDHAGFLGDELKHVDLLLLLMGAACRTRAVWTGSVGTAWTGAAETEVAGAGATAGAGAGAVPPVACGAETGVTAATGTVAGARASDAGAAVEDFGWPRLCISARSRSA
ncbi:hypothetical protein [Gluconobacter oxydans]|uniref:hypothetical protein n=1 Tax=Gluconobacter oxydans TaxID=442 RepID=UPI0026491B0B|nr:hypothetical protein [Gluconobacter oxydans]WKE49667.1 hypothetical protein NUJ38_13995 [Gluconobacter oxydans]